MVPSAFVVLFVILPLTLAVLFLLYRSRILLRNMAAVAVLAFGVWGVLKLVSTDFTLFERRAAVPETRQSVDCYTLTRKELANPSRDCML